MGDPRGCVDRRRHTLGKIMERIEMAHYLSLDKARVFDVLRRERTG
jgi:hypothetical protein